MFRESATIAHTYARSFMAGKDLGNKFLTASAVHIHVPQVRGLRLLLLCMLCCCLVLVLSC